MHQSYPYSPWFLYNPQNYVWHLNSLPNDKILDQFKFKAFSDNKINAAEMIISLTDRVENIVGKGENLVVTSIFSFSYNVFKSLLLQGR